MKKFILLLILLLLPTTAYPQGIYDVSCRNVAKIKIVKIEAAPWNMDSCNGYFHVLAMELKPDAAKKFVTLRMTTPTICIRYRGEDRYTKDIVITANGKPLKNDAPCMTGFSDQAIIIPIIREKDAFAAARQVCPALIPDKVIMDGHWDE